MRLYIVYLIFVPIELASIVAIRKIIAKRREGKSKRVSKPSKPEKESKKLKKEVKKKQEKPIVIEKKEEEALIPEFEEKKPIVDQKKRLFGMIKLRKEIDLNEAGKFLKTTPSEIEALLYDLAGENVIQGKFEQNKFVIESDIDNFLKVLDDSFSKWSQKKETKTGKRE